MKKSESGTEALKSHSRTRQLTGNWDKLVSFLAIGLSCFQLYCTVVAMPSPVFLRGIHLVLAMSLVFCLYPVSARFKEQSKVPVYDWLLIAVSAAAGAYIVWAYDDLVWRMGDFYPYEIWLGAGLIILVLEAVRRAVGPPLAIIGTLFILYDLFGNFSPIYAHAGFSIERTVGLLYLSLEGIYGMPLGVMTSFVFLFILFSGFLRHTGAGDFLINLSFALMGKYRGGPAKAAALASGLFGSISGSITANVVGTGSITIPMMRRLGYKPEFAGAVEVAASTGGQLMPPIMGAGAFIMAEWTGIPYATILFVSIIPAIAYYVSVISFIHFNAGRYEIGKVDTTDIPSLRETLRKGWHYIIPIAILIAFLASGYSPMYSASLGIFSFLLVYLVHGLIDRKSNPDLKEFMKKFARVCLLSLESGAKGAILVSAAMACAGIIMGSVGPDRNRSQDIQFPDFSDRRQPVFDHYPYCAGFFDHGHGDAGGRLLHRDRHPGRPSAKNPWGSPSGGAPYRVLVQPGCGGHSAGLPVFLRGGRHQRGQSIQDRPAGLETGQRALCHAVSVRLHRSGQRGLAGRCYGGSHGLPGIHRFRIKLGGLFGQKGLGLGKNCTWNRSPGLPIPKHLFICAGSRTANGDFFKPAFGA